MEEDLYGDLDLSGKAPSKPSSAPKQINIQEERAEITMLRKQLAASQKENETLKRNIGTLYRTATNELKRKDNRILELEQELTRFR